MNKKPYLQLSVHGLVDSLLRSGDIDSRVYNQETMRLGSLIHSSYQEKQGKEYLSEQALSCVIETELGTIALSGRADGIILGGPFPIIDEIKSTVLPLDVFFDQQKEWHLGQALCYGYMYLQNSKYDQVGVQLTYISQIHSEEKEFHSFVFSRQEVEEKVKGFVWEYLSEKLSYFAHIEERDASSKGLKFPFSSFREGQKKLAQCVYGIAKHGGVFFAEAPTGIGKTISVLFPGCLSFQEGHVDKLFYLTAKNTGVYSAYDALTLLYEQGLVARDSSLLAKEKICFCPGHACNPDDCPFAKGYYDKVKDAVKEAVATSNRFDLMLVSKIARKYEICPFEFQLDLSLEADVIIADYNYFFDPFTHLERYFDDQVDASKDLIFVDEAHNLVDRSRSMYSAEVSYLDAKFARKALKGDKYKSIRKAIKKAEQCFDCLADEERTELEKSPIELEKAFESLKRAETKELKEQSTSLPEEYRFFRREFGRYMRIANEFANSTYKLYATRSEENVSLHLNCLDPSEFLYASFRKTKGAVLFSATLSPIQYYTKALTGKEEQPYLLLPSPFDKENLKVLIAPKISTRYKDRERSYRPVAEYLMAFAKQKVGNYFFYFPSYAYMENVRPFLDFPGCNVLIQDRKMNAEDRAVFLESFVPNPSVTTIGLIILGGAFSEGVDLVDDRLIGVAIVGVGLPQVGYENDLIREYYDKRSKDGFDYAYKYPGLNKVTQAVGRLIRSETDRGAVMLIDDRYLHGDYRPLMERLWPEYSTVFHPQEVAEELSSFYKKKDD